MSSQNDMLNQIEEIDKKEKQKAYSKKKSVILHNRSNSFESEDSLEASRPKKMKT